MYKKSKYNIFVPTDSGTIIFNSLTGSIGIFDEEAMNRYETNTCTQEEETLLLKKGVFIDENFDEWQKMTDDRVKGIQDFSTKYVRIWTTSDCNARCYYCYEKGIKAEWMSEKTADQVVVFIDNLVEKGNTLYIEWFGGEPLMNSPIIDYIMENLQQVIDAKNLKVESKIITNGSFITDEIAEKMATTWNTKMVQVTLDGAFDKYNRVKNYKPDNHSSFEKVIENIHKLANKDIKVAIRMNYNMQNRNDLEELVDFIVEEFKGEKHIYAYVYPIWDCLNSNEEHRFQSKAQADDGYIFLLKKLVALGMGNVRDIARLNYRAHQCRSCTEFGYSVFPDGQIGKCSETFVQKIGDIWNGVTDKETEAIWTSTEVDDGCRDCQMMPLCQGGCRSAKFTAMQRCYVNKDILPELLKWYVETLKSKTK